MHTRVAGGVTATPAMGPQPQRESAGKAIHLGRHVPGGRGHICSASGGGENEDAALSGARVLLGSTPPTGADSCDSCGPQPQSAMSGPNELGDVSVPQILAQYTTAEWGNVVDRELLLARLHGARNGSYFADMTQDALLKLLVSSRARAKALTRRDCATPDSEASTICSPPTFSSPSSASPHGDSNFEFSPYAGERGPLLDQRRVRFDDPIAATRDDNQVSTEPRPRGVRLRPCVRGGSARLREEVAVEAIPRSTVRSNAAIRRGYLLKLGIAPPPRAAPPVVGERALEEEGEAARRADSPVGGPDAPRAWNFDDTEMAYALGEARRAESLRMDELGRAMLIKRCASWNGSGPHVSPILAARRKRRLSTEYRSAESSAEIPSPCASPSPRASPAPSAGPSPKVTPATPSPTKDKMVGLLGLVRSTSLEALGLAGQHRSVRVCASTGNLEALGEKDSAPLIANQDQLLYGGWCM